MILFKKKEKLTYVSIYGRDDVLKYQSICDHKKVYINEKDQNIHS